MDKNIAPPIFFCGRLQLSQVGDIDSICQNMKRKFDLRVIDQNGSDRHSHGHGECIINSIRNMDGIV